MLPSGDVLCPLPQICSPLQQSPLLWVANSDQQFRASVEECLLCETAIRLKMMSAPQKYVTSVMLPLYRVEIWKVQRFKYESVSSLKSQMLNDSERDRATKQTNKTKLIWKSQVAAIRCALSPSRHLNYSPVMSCLNSLAENKQTLMLRPKTTYVNKEETQTT